MYTLPIMDIKPWMSVRDIAVIKEILSWWDMRVFEYGCGGSTVYFKDRCKYWTAVEHNPEWFEKIRKGGGEVYLRSEKERYIKHPGGVEDLIIIDGRWREECLEYTRERVKWPGLILCHDANRSIYRKHVALYLWHRKVGDDLFIMSNVIPANGVVDSLNKFELRNVYSPSYAWDRIHTFGQDLPYCGFQS